MKPVAAAGRYARALAEIAGEKDAQALAALAAEVDLLAATIGTDPALLRFFDSPTAAADEQKQAAMATLADKAHLSDLARRFLAVLVEHRRTGALRAIALDLAAFRDRAAGIVEAEATFARPPGPAEEQAMQAALETMTGSRVRLAVKVDPDLLGGVTTRVGSRIYDGTLKTRLQALHRRLARA